MNIKENISIIMRKEAEAIQNIVVTDDFEASISFVGTKGLAQIGGIAVNELQVFTPDPLACATSSEDFVGIEGHGAVYGYGHSKMYTDIVAHLLNKSPYPVGRDDCLGTLYLLHSLYASDEAGDWVRVSEGAISRRLGRANSAISELYRTAFPDQKFNAVACAEKLKLESLGMVLSDAAVSTLWTAVRTWRS